MRLLRTIIKGTANALVIAGMFVVSSSAVQAESVRLDFQRVAGPTNAAGTHINVRYSTNGGNSYTTTQAGRFNWRVVSGGTAAGTALFGGVYNATTNPTTVFTFCINLFYTLNDPALYNIIPGTMLDTLPSPGTPMGEMAESKLRILANEFQAGKGLASYLNNLAELQVAIWNIVNASTSTVDGPFRILDAGTNGDGGTLNTSKVDAILTFVHNQYLSNYNYNGITQFVGGLDSTNPTGGQDQIFFTTSPQLIVEVPVPAGIVLLGVGVVSMAGLSRGSRRLRSLISTN